MAFIIILFYIISAFVFKGSVTADTWMIFTGLIILSITIANKKD